MKAGFAKMCITPPIGTAMEGYGARDTRSGCNGVLDDLFVRALYLSDGHSDAIVMAFDVCFFEPATVDRMKALVRERVDLPPERVLFNSSHTHSGPRLTHWYGLEPSAESLRQIEKAVAEVAAHARDGAREVTMHAGTGRTTLPVSRRMVGEDGLARWGASPTGPVCDALPVCVMKDAAGEIVCLLFSVSCHPSTINSWDISPDYAGAAVRSLNERWHTDGAMFLQGAGGDAKPRTTAVLNDQWRRGTPEDVLAAGQQVAGEVSAVIGGGSDAGVGLRYAGRMPAPQTECGTLWRGHPAREPVAQPSTGGLTPIEPQLRSFMTDLRWPMGPGPSRTELESVRDSTKDAQRRRWAAQTLATLDREGHFPDHAIIGLHALQLRSQLRLVGLEGEAVAELGLDMLRDLPHGVTFPMGYTNGTRLYLPADHMFAEGGYEVESYWEYGYPASLAPGGQAALASALRQAAEGLDKMEARVCT